MSASPPSGGGDFGASPSIVCQYCFAPTLNLKYSIERISIHTSYIHLRTRRGCSSNPQGQSLRSKSHYIVANSRWSLMLYSLTLAVAPFQPFPVLWQAFNTSCAKTMAQFLYNQLSLVVVGSCTLYNIIVEFRWKCSQAWEHSLDHRHRYSIYM